MAVTVKKIVLWRREVANRPGAVAEVLRPLADAGVSLQVAMGYRFPGDPGRAAIELFPVTGKRAQSAAREAGLAPSDIPTILVIGDDRPGLGSDITEALAEAGINLAFIVAQVIGRKYSGVFGLDSEEDARKATALVKRASQPKKRR